MPGSRPILSLLLCFGAIATRSQEILFFRQNAINWAAIEKKPTPAQINTFIAQNREDFPQYHDKPGEPYDHTLAELPTSLHFLDLDGDHQPDVIYDGISGGEPNEIRIYLKRGNTYQHVFTTYQAILQMDWQSGRLHKLYIENRGCCDDPVNTTSIYQVDYASEGLPKFTQIFQGCYLKETSFPDTLFEKPLRFEVLNPDYNIRLKPVVDDTTRQEWDATDDPLHGNKIATLVKGASGTALAKKIDGTGREWWFVEIDEEYYPTSGYGLPGAGYWEFPTKVTGWISSRFVKKL